MTFDFPAGPVTTDPTIISRKRDEWLKANPRGHCRIEWLAGDSNRWRADLWTGDDWAGVGHSLLSGDDALAQALQIAESAK